jgi:hypothetical protein
MRLYKCKHDTLIEDANAPEMDCPLCAEAIAYQEILCVSCLYRWKKIYADDTDTGCAVWAGIVSGEGRDGVVQCSDYARR